MGQGSRRVRHELNLFVMVRTLSGAVGPSRRVEGRLTAWEDGRWRVSMRVEDGPPVVIDGDAAYPDAGAIDRLMAAITA